MGPAVPPAQLRWHFDNQRRRSGPIGEHFHSSLDDRGHLRRLHHLQGSLSLAQERHQTL